MRHVSFERLHNFRDLGGYPTRDGRSVRWGRLYRSDALGKLAGADWDRFLALDVRTVIDLRYPFEIARSGRVPAWDGLAYHNFSVEHRPYDQASLDPSVEPERFLADRMLEVASDGVVELRQVLEAIAAGPAPVVIHCQSGKDRTGLVAALVLSLLGVAEEDIVADFTLTSLATDRLVADWKANYPDHELRWPFFGQAPAGILRLFLADLAALHGSVPDYVADKLGVDESVIASLRGGLLTG